MRALSGEGRYTVGIVLLLVVLGACYRSRGELATTRPTPAPAPGFAAVVDSARPSSQVLREYVAKLTFDTAYEAGDAQRLAVGKYPDMRYGPLVAIQPEIGNHTLLVDDLHRGRIIARIVNSGDEPYPKLGLAPHSVTYWWAELGRDSAANRSVMISTDTTGAIVNRLARPLHYDIHQAVYRSRAVARWIWSDEDEQGWSSCGNSCCKN